MFSTYNWPDWASARQTLPRYDIVITAAHEGDFLSCCVRDGTMDSRTAFNLALSMRVTLIEHSITLHALTARLLR